MATITIRNLGTALKRKLQMRAAQHARSIEDEALQILRAGLAETTAAPNNLFESIRRRVGPLGGVKLKIPRRRSGREPPTFNDA